MGGEKSNRVHIAAVCTGSPPRGRGKVLVVVCGDLALGITPAWAGKSQQTDHCDDSTEDHPRVGGEKWNCLFANASALGSPPRGRGKENSGLFTEAIRGITPAWAGKSFRAAESRQACRDHPRVGGEKYRSSRTSTCVKGSPPRGRGKEIVDITEWPTNRITPAWAGKSCFLRFFQLLIRDHPRVGGEKKHTKSWKAATAGSPPRGRGKAAWSAG